MRVLEMISVHSVRSILCISLCVMAIGCSQIPTEKQSAVDLRPQISFRIADENLSSARVVVDGLDMGPVSEYLENQASLKLLPGKHIVSLYLHDRIAYQETVYVGHGNSRTVIVQ